MTAQNIEIRQASAKEMPLDLVLMADPSIKLATDYMSSGMCYVAYQADEPVGEYVLRNKEPGIFELMNIAIKAELQQHGIGTTLLQHAIEVAKSRQAVKLEVGTGCFGPQLSFYQRAGFRVMSIEKDFFITNYSEPIFENGIQHHDMLRLAIVF